MISHFKVLRYEDAVAQSKKENIPLDMISLLKAGFDNEEIEYFMIKYKEEQKMTSIYKLEQQVKTLKSTIKNLKVRNKTTIKVVDLKTDWFYTISRVSKNTKQPYKNYKYVSKKKVNALWKILKMLTNKQNPTTNYRQIVSALITKLDIDVNIDAFNGGRNRAKLLFVYYYYPLKILHELGYINYSKHSTVTRLVFTNKCKI